MDVVTKYFPNLSVMQIKQIAALPILYEEWNARINVISRKDMENIMIHHILHSLAIAKFIDFKKGSNILDLGTGGGLPGIPLAILFPEVEFVLIDGKAKKINVANAIIENIGLQNCSAFHKRAEEMQSKYDFVIARAVTRLSKLIPIVKTLIAEELRNPIPNGLITLKGGDLEEEIKEVKRYTENIGISEYFQEAFFETKRIVYVPMIKV